MGFPTCGCRNLDGGYEDVTVPLPTHSLKSARGLPALLPPYDWLDVHDGRSINSFQIAHPNSEARDVEDLHRMEPNGVGPVGRAQAEDANVGGPLRTSQRGAEDVATGQVKPGDHDDAVANLQIPQSLLHVWFEDQPCGGCAFVTLLRCVRRVDQGRLHPGYRSQLINLHRSVSSVAIHRDVWHPPNVTRRLTKSGRVARAERRARRPARPLRPIPAPIRTQNLSFSGHPERLMCDGPSRLIPRVRFGIRNRRSP